jgi:hypothetical protein
MEWIYYLSVMVGLIEMLTTDYEKLRIEALKKNIRISEWEFLLVKTIMAFIPILNTIKGIKFIYLKITKTNKNG